MLFLDCSCFGAIQLAVFSVSGVDKHSLLCHLASYLQCPSSPSTAFCLEVTCQKPSQSRFWRCQHPQRLDQEEIIPSLQSSHHGAHHLEGVSLDAISPELTVDDVKERQVLHPLKKISSIFSGALMDEHVHVLVQAPTDALHKHFLDSS